MRPENIQISLRISEVRFETVQRSVHSKRAKATDEQQLSDCAEVLAVMTLRWCLCPKVHFLKFRFILR